MSTVRGIFERVRETLARPRVEWELDEEIRFHLKLEIERLMADGMNRESARHEAKRRFGRVRRAKEAAREEFGFRGLELAAREVRHAARGLRKSPSFTIAAVLTLGLGIGATTAIFSVLNGVVLRPLPYPDPGRMVSVSHTDDDGDRLGMPDGGYFFYAENASTLSDLAAYLELSQVIRGTGAPFELAMALATPSIFDVFRVRPIHGRLFTAADAEPGAPDVAVLTYGFWLRQFGGDPDAIGQPLTAGSDIEVIGVLPQDFEFARADASIVFGNSFDQPDVLVPLTMRQTSARFGNFMYQGIGRLAEGVTAEGSARELAALMPQAAEAYPGLHTVASLREGGHRPVVRTLQDAIVGRLASTLWILLGAVGLVLLIATANVANLFLARAESQRREIAVRRSLGAGMKALARASMAEGVVLSTFGGVLGLALAAIGVRLLLGLAPPDLPRLDEAGLDARVLAFAGALTILTGFVFGLFPLLSHARTDARAALGEESRGATTGSKRQRTRRLLVAAQVAFALVLLIGAGLLVRTFQNLRDVDPGFDGSNVLTLRASLHGLYSTDVEATEFLLDLTRRLEGVPGVEVATFAGDLPLDGDEWRDDVAVEGALPTNESEKVSALRVFVGPGYLEAIGARLMRGRELERLDFDGYPEFVVVNEAFAEQRWPGEEAIGKRLMQGGNSPDEDVWYTVSGIVADIREGSLMTPPEPTVYLPTVFKPDDDYAMFVRNMPVVVRTEGDPLVAFRAIERELHAFNPELPINSVMTLGELEARSFQQVSFAMTLVVIAAIVALVLGFIGIYGVVAYLVSLRSREFGIRMALGATPGHLRRTVLREGGVIALTGILVGLAGAVLASRIFASLLFGVAATDLATYGVVSLGLLMVVMLASLGPAQRSTSVDPVAAIRAE